VTVAGRARIERGVVVRLREAPDGRPRREQLAAALRETLVDQRLVVPAGELRLLERWLEDRLFGLGELAPLLRGGVHFVGVMGSARHTAPHLAALRAAGCSDDELARLRTPVGLDLGARTPAEIALSILAGLLAARTGHTGGWLDHR